MRPAGRTNQKTQPWEGWAYAQEAVLTSDTAARQSAIVKARYLDRNSERLKRVPKNALDEADKALKKSPPFRINRRQATLGV